MKKSILLFCLVGTSMYAVAQEKSSLSKGTQVEQANPQNNSSVASDSIAVQNKINERAEMKKQLIEQNQNNSVKREPNPRVTEYDDQGRIIISKEKFDRMPENRQKWILENSDKYVVQ